MRSNGASLAQISDTLRINKGTVSRILTRAIHNATPDQHDLDEARRLQAIRIEQRRLDAVRVLSRPHPVLYQGEVVTVTDDDGEPVPLDDDGIRLQAIASIRDADRDLAALWGLDSAKKYEHAGPDGGPVPVEIRVADLLQRTREARLMALPSPNGDGDPAS